MLQKLSRKRFTEVKNNSAISRYVFPFIIIGTKRIFTFNHDKSTEPNRTTSPSKADLRAVDLPYRELPSSPDR